MGGRAAARPRAPSRRPATRGRATLRSVRSGGQSPRRPGKGSDRQACPRLGAALPGLSSSSGSAARAARGRRLDFALGSPAPAPGARSLRPLPRGRAGPVLPSPHPLRGAARAEPGARLQREAEPRQSRGSAASPGSQRPPLALSAVRRFPGASRSRCSSAPPPLSPPRLFPPPPGAGPCRTAAVTRAEAPERDKHPRPLSGPAPAARRGEQPRCPRSRALRCGAGGGGGGGGSVGPCRGAALPGARLPLRPEPAAPLFVYFPAAVAGCQARGPFLLKTHFSCPARSSSSLAALRCAVNAAPRGATGTEGVGGGAPQPGEAMPGPGAPRPYRTPLPQHGVGAAPPAGAPRGAAPGPSPPRGCPPVGRGERIQQ